MSADDHLCSMHNRIPQYEFTRRSSDLSDGLQTFTTREHMHAAKEAESKCSRSPGPSLVRHNQTTKISRLRDSWMLGLLLYANHLLCEVGRAYADPSCLRCILRQRVRSCVR